MGDLVFGGDDAVQAELNDQRLSEQRELEHTDLTKIALGEMDLDISQELPTNGEIPSDDKFSHHDKQLALGEGNMDFGGHQDTTAMEDNHPEELLMAQHDDDDDAQIDRMRQDPEQSNEGGRDNHSDQAQPKALADEDEAEDSEDHQLTQPTSGRKFPIEVHLTPPSDPKSYQKLPPSWIVETVRSELQVENNIFYEVEFDDGRIDQAAYNDLLDMENGQLALKIFHRDQSLASKPADMRSRAKHSLGGSEEDSSDYGSHKRPRSSAIPARRSSRQKTISRQQSILNDSEDNSEDDLGDAVGPVGRSSRQNTSSRQVSADIEMNHDSDEDQPIPHQSDWGSGKRVTRSSNRTAPTRNAFQSSEDELANNSDDDAFMPVVSDLAPPKRGKSRRKKSARQAQQQRRYKDRDSSIEFEVTNRRSGRSAGAKNYVAPDVEDDYVIYEEKGTAVPKHMSVKELFKAIDKRSAFAQSHSNECEVCEGNSHVGKGPLIYCQGCTYSFHKACLGTRSAREHRVTKVGEDEFVLQCRLCIGTYRKKDGNAPNHAKCETCKLENPSCREFSTKKTPKQEEKLREENGGKDPITPVDPALINNAESLLFRCSSCRRGFHIEHLPPLTKDGEITEDVRADRLSEYSLVDWRCKDCVDANHKIHALVAWRPVNQGCYVQGQTWQQFTEDEREYLVKWETRSHFHDTWMPGAWVFGVAAATMRASFLKRDENHHPKMTTKDAVDEEWLLADVFFKVQHRKNPANPSRNKDLARIGDIKDVYVKFQGLGYSEAVWDSPPPQDSGAPWEAFRAAYEEYVNGMYFEVVQDHKMKERIQQYRKLDFAKECELREVQPSGLKRGKLMGYQLEGVNWLLYSFHQKSNVILADEMGLGKTIQVVALISSLVHDKPNCWPFLIVVPNATCPNWRRELKHWAPDLRIVTYHGGKEAQNMSYQFELYPFGVKEGMRAHVVIMSFEAAVEAQTTFRKVNWAGLIVDEGQRLKNDQSLLYQALQGMKIPFRLLLTGTPLQNNKRELFNLLHFVDPTHNAEELDQKYAELTKDNIRELHSLIRPYFLRRTKAQVLKFLPPMAQIILPVSMSVLQEKLSKLIMARNPQLIKAIISKSKIRAGERKSLNNVLMELRRTLCHPFIFSDDVEDRSITDPVEVQRNLVEASGKLLLLNIMLPKLKARGHRVLIFSQFLLSLTIIEDFLNALGLEHARIDGSLSALEKQKRIDAYNAPDSPLFAMLLSTRAGGVGINLATADTVIIYDPDFNPHQDIQALSRAHRIGQKNKVLCFQLMTKDSVEEQIMEAGRRKMALDHALIESMDADEDAGNDIESMLRRGAQKLFSDEARTKITYDDASVEKLLDRSQIENTESGDDQSAESQFSFARVWANDEGKLTTNAASNEDEDGPAPGSVWENILREREAEHQRELAASQQTYGRGARRRGTQGISYNHLVGGYIEDVNDEFLIDAQKQERDGGDSESEIDDELYIDGNVAESGDDANEEFVEGSSRKRGIQATAHPMQPTRPLPNRRPSDPPPPPRRQPPSQPTPWSAAKPLNEQLPTQQPPALRLSQAPAVKPQPKRRGRPPKSQQIPVRNQAPAPYSWSSGPVQGQPMLSTETTPMRQPTVPRQHQQQQQHQKMHMSGPNDSRFGNIDGGDTQGQGMAPNATYRASSSHIYRVPRPPAHSVLPSQTTAGMVSQPAAGVSVQDISDGCVVCQGQHSNCSCVNMDSIMDLRLAVDMLRASQAGPAVVQALRQRLQQRIRELTGPR